MENRILINGIWYVAEQNNPQKEVKTVDWMISKLHELSESGYGNYKVTVDVDYGNDYDTVDAIFVMENGRVHIS
jgi:hypothetical protein